MPVLGFELADALLLSGQWLADARLAQLFGINLGQPASYGRLAQLHVLADLANAQALGADHFNDLQFEARVEYSSFGFRHFYYPGDFHLSVCTKSLDQDIEVTTYRTAIKAMKATAGKLPAVTLASGAYAMAVQPQKWMLDAFDKTASAAVLNFIRDYVHDSKAGFIQGLEPFTYFRPRGMAESSRNVLAQGLQWLDEGVTAVETGVIKIYHTTEGIVSEKWFQGKLLAKQTYQVGEKFTIDAYHAGHKFTVKTYDSGKQVVIETVDAGQQFVVSSYNSASKALDDFVSKTKAQAKALEKTAESAAKRVARNAEDLLQEGVKDVQDGWNANRAWLGF